MISFAGHPLLLDTDTPESLLHEYLSARGVEDSDTEFIRVSLKTYSDLLQAGSIVDVPLNTWRSPSGAHRFGYGHFLTELPLSEWYKKHAPGSSSTLQFTDEKNTFSIPRVRILRHRPLSTIDPSQSLYLMTLVDERYSAAVRTVGTPSYQRSGNNVKPILTLLAARAGIAINLDDLPSNLPQIDIDTLKHHTTFPVGLVLEGIINELGYRTIYKWDTVRKEYRLTPTVNSETASKAFNDAVLAEKSYIFLGSSSYTPWHEGNTFPTTYNVGSSALSLSNVSQIPTLVGNGDTVVLPLPRLKAPTSQQRLEIARRWLSHSRGSSDVVLLGVPPEKFPFNSTIDHYQISHHNKLFATRILPHFTYQSPVDLLNTIEKPSGAASPPMQLVPAGWLLDSAGQHIPLFDVRYGHLVTVTGKVLDGAGKPIPDVVMEGSIGSIGGVRTIGSLGDQPGGKTNQDGEYSVSVTPYKKVYASGYNDIVIELRAPGFNPNPFIVPVPQPQAITQDFTS